MSKLEAFTGVPSFQKDADDAPGAIWTGYLESLALVERLHRLLLDVIKDEFERLGILEINAVQGLLLFNIGDNEVTAGELKSRGYYQGSNVSYNLKKLVEYDFMHHQRCEIDRRSVRVRLTDKGRKVRDVVQDLFLRTRGARCAMSSKTCFCATPSGWKRPQASMPTRFSTST